AAPRVVPAGVSPRCRSLVGDRQHPGLSRRVFGPPPRRRVGGRPGPPPLPRPGLRAAPVLSPLLPPPPAAPGFLSHLFLLCCGKNSARTLRITGQLVVFPQQARYPDRETESDEV